MATETWKCVANSGDPNVSKGGAAWIHSGPGTSYSLIGLIYKGETATVTEKKGYWLNIGKGWVSEYDSAAGGSRPLMQKTSTDKPVEVKPEVVKDFKEVTSTLSAYIPDLDQYRVFMTTDDYLNSLDGALRIKNLRGIHGMPYQFMANVDTRLGTAPDSIGRKYAEKIVAQMPLLLMTPGTPVFLSKYTKKQKDSFLKGIVDFTMGQESQLEEMLGWDGKYYSIKFDYKQYFQYVNPMCRTAARFLGIQDHKIDGVALDKYGWDQNHNEGINGSIKFNSLRNIQKTIAYRSCVPFYVESETQISESFSNSTSESPLSSKINGYSDMGRELNFILGRADASAGLNLDKFTNQEDLNSNIEVTNDLISKLLKGDGIFAQLAANVQTVAAGGRLIFPEIWSDSQFSRSYNINLKLVTPDCDPLSWYLNICVPMMHLLAFVLPRQVEKSQGYISPFIVRAFYKGFFNCDMGIITDMTFNKGQEGCWTKEGLPTVVDVSFTIKDLYSIMAMTNNQHIRYNIMNNIAELDYIANLCGLNINEPDVGRMIDMFLTQNVSNKFTDALRLNLFGGIEQSITNSLLNLFLSGIR